MDTSVIALAIAVVALVFAVVAFVIATTGGKPGRRPGRTAGRRLGRRRTAGNDLPNDLAGLRSEVQALQIEVSDALRHLSVVRYDAFGDMGGHLSWSMALLDDSGNGVVLTSIHGRSEARTYAKNVATWASEQALSPEEEEALKLARS